MAIRSRTRTLAPTDGLLRMSEVFYDPGEVQRTHAHPETSVTLVIAGEIEERVGSRVECAGPLSVVVKPGGVDHADRVGPRGLRTLQIALCPNSETVQCAPGDGLRSWQWLHPSLFAGRLISLLDAYDSASASSVEARMAIYDVLGLVADEVRTRRSASAPSWLEEVRDAVDEDVAFPPSVESLARRAGVHPIALARAFRRHFGMSVTERIRFARVRAAAARLCGHEPITAIAHAIGFSDHAHLCRVFRRVTGLPPSRYRRLAAGQRDPPRLG